MVTKTILLSSIALTLHVHAQAALSVSNATIYHTFNEMGQTTDSLVHTGPLPGSHFSTYSGQSGMTIDLDDDASSFRADALTVKEMLPFYTYYSTHGSANLTVDEPFEIGGVVFGRGAGEFTLTPLVGEGEAYFAFGYNYYNLGGTLPSPIPSGDYTLSWNVSAWTMNGTGGVGGAQFTLTNPGSTPEPGTLALLALPLALTRRR